MTRQTYPIAQHVRIRALVMGICALLIAALLPVTSAEATAPGKKNACDRRVNNTYAKLLECVTLEGVRAHQAEFQRIADRNDGNRASGTPGYDQSADYVAKKLRRAGYEVTRQEFDFVYFEILDSALTIDGEELAPIDLATGEGDFYAFDYSGAGEVTDAVIVPTLDVVVPIGDSPPNTSTSGCEPEDFEPAPEDQDAIALVQRGECAFAIKALNAQEAGYDGVIVFNEGQEGREDIVFGTLGEESFGVIDIPVVGISYERGAALVQASEPPTADLSVETFGEVRQTENVIAESRGGNPDNVVMAGAHLDSVPEGPGINDNGSGSAALLETALKMAKVKPVNKLRFAWWGAEEAGLVGSYHYVESLIGEDDDTTELDRIALYLNYDMVGSPNYVLMVYDADESTFEAPVPVPEGSTAIEDVYERFYTWRGVPYDDTEFSGRSDYQPFILSGIPAGGLFTGAEVVKTPEQEAIWGGTAGEQFDPCYHLACDTYENNSDEALDVNSDAIAFAMLTFAYSTEDVNGVPGKRVPGRPLNLPEPAGPEGTFQTDAGGGGHAHPHE